jgi:hypothetical protein
MSLINKPPLLEYVIKPVLADKLLNDERRYHIFHPSAWGYCQRKVAYQYYNEKDKFLKFSEADVDPRVMRIFDNGHAIHDRWQSYLDKAGVLRGNWRCEKCSSVYGTENKIGIFNPSRAENWKCSCGATGQLSYQELIVKSPPQYNFEGHTDGVIDLTQSRFATKSPLDVFVVDMKSINKDQFNELAEAKQEHVIQVNIYMWILDLKGAVLVYECKDNQAVKEFFCPRDENMIERIKAEALLMVSALHARKIPPRPAGFSRTKYPCKGCEFMSYCY